MHCQMLVCLFEQNKDRTTQTKLKGLTAGAQHDGLHH